MNVCWIAWQDRQRPAAVPVRVERRSSTQNARGGRATCGPPRYLNTALLVLVVRLSSVEDSLHRLEVPDMRLLVAVLRRGFEFRDRVVDHVLRQDVQLASRLHGQNLLLRVA